MPSTRVRGAQGPSARLLVWLRGLTAVEYVGVAGLLWLLLYVFNRPVRDWTLGVVWRLEMLIASALGLTLPQASPSAREPDLLPSLVVIGVYCLVSLVLSGQRARGLPSADELVGGGEASQLPTRPGSRER